jgi:hypothetical protein
MSPSSKSPTALAVHPFLSGASAIEEALALKPEWIRIPTASRVSGLSRTFLFEQIVQGKIESKHLKRPGKTRGIRLINYASLMRFIEGLES